MELLVYTVCTLSLFENVYVLFDCLLSSQQIEEFTDVNEGEKEIMKLWNLHVMKQG